MRPCRSRSGFTCGRSTLTILVLVIVPWVRLRGCHTIGVAGNYQDRAVRLNANGRYRCTRPLGRLQDFDEVSLREPAWSSRTAAPGLPTSRRRRPALHDCELGLAWPFGVDFRGRVAEVRFKVGCAKVALAHRCPRDVRRQHPLLQNPGVPQPRMRRFPNLTSVAFMVRPPATGRSDNSYTSQIPQ